MEFYEGTKSVDLSNEDIKSIPLNSTENKVKDVLGKPDFVIKIENPKSNYYIYGKNEKNYDLEFRLVRGKVKSYLISSSKYTLSKGITIGNSKTDVMNAYGKNYYERTDTGANIIGYYDKVNNINIEFGMSDNKVNGIIVSGGSIK